MRNILIIGLLIAMLSGCIKPMKWDCGSEQIGCNPKQNGVVVTTPM